ncbi:hypothetical protein HYPGJ_31043 [Hyphomicrobium sp. GJ21]|nr:hypothetical protein HYPGJ_31043 [Hyphomicrobium sp. GJ21]
MAPGMISATFLRTTETLGMLAKKQIQHSSNHQDDPTFLLQDGVEPIIRRTKNLEWLKLTLKQEKQLERRQFYWKPANRGT